MMSKENTWANTFHVGDIAGILGSELSPVPVLATVTTGSEPVDGRSMSPLAPQTNSLDQGNLNWTCVHYVFQKYEGSVFRVIF